MTGDAVPKMVGMFTSDPAFFECLREELSFVDLVPEAVLFPHIERSIEGSFRVGIIGVLGYSMLDVDEWDFVFLFHRTLIIYNFEVEIFHLLSEMDRD